MYLARNKNGRIGRQIPGVGEQARVDASRIGDRRGQLYLSEGSIKETEAFNREEENKSRAISEAKRLKRIAKRYADKIRQDEKAIRANLKDRLNKYDPVQESLRGYYGRRQMMGESSQVLSDIMPPSPADFSSSGANPQYVPGEEMTGGKQWRADFRQHLIVGNVLTRDGQFGPQITDYDRFVNGRDINQWDVVDTKVVGGPTAATSGRFLGRSDDLPIVGGTILGRMNNQSIKLDMKRNEMGGIGIMPRGLGFDWSWSGITDAISNVATQTVDQTINKLPDQLSKELQEEIFKSGGQVVSSGGGVVNVQRPVTGQVTTIQQSLGIPSWALYTGIGILGLGLTFVMIKAIKS